MVGFFKGGAMWIISLKQIDVRHLSSRPDRVAALRLHADRAKQRFLQELLKVFPDLEGTLNPVEWVIFPSLVAEVLFDDELEWIRRWPEVCGLEWVPPRCRLT